MKVKRPRNMWDNVEAGLGSVGRIRILRETIRRPNQFFTKYALEKATGLKPVNVRNDLKLLVDLGWVKEFACDPKTYRINMENDAVKIIAEFFHKIGKK
jgi:Fic family protein